MGRSTLSQSRQGPQCAQGLQIARSRPGNDKLMCQRRALRGYKAPRLSHIRTIMHRRNFFGLALATALTLPWRAALAGEQDQGAPPSGFQWPAPSVNPAFDAWLSGFMARAVAAGWPQDLLTRELGGLTPDPKVVSLDGRQPELSRPVGDYIRKTVSQDKIAAGQARMYSLTFWPGIEARFGVPREILLGIWGMETAFGAVMGNYDVIRSMATLAAEGRRQAWAEAQIFSALRIIASGQISREQLRGSWAGAMGQTQFLPETYVTAAIDFDGDGRKDLWGSQADALASAANLLVKGGWRRGEPWAREVILAPGFDYGLSEGPMQLPAAWSRAGARPAGAWDWSAQDARTPSSLILPAGWTGPAFLVSANHMAIRTYNNSTAYALGVGLLADAVAGRPGPITPWPVELALSLSDRQKAQSLLGQLGFYAGERDGVIGTRTRKALRQWQVSMGRPADGYLTPDLIFALEAAAWGMPSQPSQTLQGWP